MERSEQNRIQQKKRIEALLPIVDENNSWENNFLDSILDWVSRSELSSAQSACLTKIEKKYGSAAERAQWAKSFSKGMRERVKLVAKCSPQCSAAARVFAPSLVDESFVPTKHDYDFFLSTNKYSQGYINNWFGEAKFKEGDPVCGRSYKEKSLKLAFVVKVNSSLPDTYAKGGRKYLILPMGEDKTLEVEERQIKKYRG